MSFYLYGYCYRQNYFFSNVGERKKTDFHRRISDLSNIWRKTCSISDIIFPGSNDFDVWCPRNMIFTDTICVILTCSTSYPGGNQVDGLPPASSFYIDVTKTRIAEKFSISFYSNYFYHLQNYIAQLLKLVLGCYYGIKIEFERRAEC